MYLQGVKIGYLPQGDLLIDQQQHDAGLNNMTVLEAVLASDNEVARAVQVIQFSFNHRLSLDFKSA